MSKPTRFTPYHTTSGWCINVPAKFSDSGKRERFFYRTQALALAAAADLKSKRDKFGEQTRAISPSLAEQATAAHALLSPYGISILEAAERIASMERATAASVPIEAALDAFQTAKEGKSDKQVQAIRHMAAHLREDFAGRQLSTITGAEVGKHVAARTGGPSAFNGKMRLLVTFWRWCAKPPREWCKPDALAHIELAETVSGEVGTLSAKDCARLMATAEKHFPDTVPAFAIGLFTGLRQQELERLEPQDVTSEGITVPATSAKTKRRRFIQMPAPLAAWLAAYPIGETITPPNWYRKEKAVRRLAGWKVWSDLVPTIDLKPILPAEPPEDAPEWPQNALRHTAASVALAIGKQLETLIFEHGHAGGVEMLRRHYIGRMPKAEALKIWALGPHGTKIPNLKIA
jgi:integrase/recombinase XerD